MSSSADPNYSMTDYRERIDMLKIENKKKYEFFEVEPNIFTPSKGIDSTILNSELSLDSDNLYKHNPCQFETYTGLLFDYANPKPEQVCFTDLCMGIVSEPRFRRHTHIKYYVMQHSLIVSYLVPQVYPILGESLFHDIEEYITGDMPKPMKKLPGMDAFIAKGNQIKNMVLDKYIPLEQKRPEQLDVNPIIKKADKIAYYIERDWFKHKSKVISSDYEIPIYKCDFSFISLFSALKDILTFKGDEQQLISIFTARCKEAGIDIEK